VKVLCSLLAVFVAVGLIWGEHLYLLEGDLLLFGIWTLMTLLLCWGVFPRRDGVRLLVGLAAGVAIESWGTVTGMWHYFTWERPPIWILPAWPVATIAIDRLGRMLNLVFPAGEHRWLWWCLIPPSAAAFLLFSWPCIGHPFSWIFLGFMLGMLAWPCPDRRQDLMLMVAGSMLGFFLEYWGTSRHCWTYYDGQVPPIAAVIAHGLAAVTIQRIAGKLAPDVADMGVPVASSR
jgi:hypothetical protein